jgi:uncharacterized damage-inducible protein DinB
MTHARSVVLTAILLAAGATSAAAQAPAAPRPPQTFAAYLQGQYATLKRNLSGSAEKMPAEHFGFRPVPEVMTYGELINHIVETQYAYCSVAKGGANPAAGKDFKKVADKAAIIQVVKDSFAYCDDAFAELSEAKALEMITAGAAPNQRQLARANQMTQLIVHGNEHYGNLITYMRIKGIVPPSSAQ